MEKVETTNSPRSVRMITVTPDDLRIVADRLEAESRNVTLNTERVCYELTPTITLVYKPEVAAKLWSQSGVVAK